MADVTLDPARKAQTAPSCRGRWTLEVPWAATQAYRAIETIGAGAYRLSRERAARARAISAKG
ncbi:MAG: hypothetical protein IT372_06045 [Polyangiaceae bacterium]|nr:hypothetical protein [Polyangiaceae bacterium]